jgi:hypothetical protein
LVADLLAPEEEVHRNLRPVKKDTGLGAVHPEPDPPPLPVCYSPARVYWITRNRWQLMVTYQPGRNLLQLAYGWARSTAFHAVKAGYLGSFLRGLAAGVARTPHALIKRFRMRRNRALSGREICRLMNGC